VTAALTDRALDVGAALDAIRARRPLVHCITNDVTVGRVADAIAAIGALPVMASAPEEAADMAAQAQALVLNLGTPSGPRWLAARAAGAGARDAGVPVVLDPVGCGATPWRTRQVRDLHAAVQPDIVRGNPPEIAALADLPAGGWVLRGVAADETGAGDVAQLAQLVQEASRVLGSVAVVTGPSDAVSDGRRVETFAGGAKALAGLVGAGDVLSALVGVCRAVVPDSYTACLVAARLFAAAGRAAARSASGPGTLWPRLLDALSTLTPDVFRGDGAGLPGQVGGSTMAHWAGGGLPAALRVYLLADTGLLALDELPSAVAAAIRGGVTAVQLRAKEVTTLEYLDLARAVGGVCRDGGVPFIVNDRVDVALASEADGAHVGHLGEEDLGPKDARRLLGAEAIVGVSVGSAQEARLATADGASYVSAGPMFTTTTKSNAGPAAGEGLLRSVRAATRVPLVVIGGITAARAAVLYAAGADGVCVGAAILRAPDPEAAARAFFEPAAGTDR